MWCHNIITNKIKFASCASNYVHIRVKIDDMFGIIFLFLHAILITTPKHYWLRWEKSFYKNKTGLLHLK